jgi:hypothetical protein
MAEPAVIETLRHARQGSGTKDQQQEEKFVFYIGLHNWLLGYEQSIFLRTKAEA